eukprot:TRINITY_DN23790_c0_g1_i1.p1 TRINITY_DN23790_c0_g1~~TRINITY_DN23790_c0_g1_i1.p1  ORF type:complete len:382 (-),score=61.51 TRINITY_DN23790_c0_g1_i1:419-1564(-)
MSCVGSLADVRVYSTTVRGEAASQEPPAFLKASVAITFTTKKSDGVMDVVKLRQPLDCDGKLAAEALIPMKIDVTCCAGLGTSCPAVPVTTMMLRNIPSKYTQEKLMNEINECGFDGTYDFFHLPTCRGGSNVGYAFINFLTEEDAKRFMSFFSDYQFRRFHSKKVSTVSVAHAQGLYENLCCFQNRAATSTKGDQFRPTVFKNGRRANFDDVLEEMNVHSSEDSSNCSTPVETREPRYVLLGRTWQRPTPPALLQPSPKQHHGVSADLLSCPPGLEDYCLSNALGQWRRSRASPSSILASSIAAAASLAASPTSESLARAGKTSTSASSTASTRSASEGRPTSAGSCDSPCPSTPDHGKVHSPPFVTMSPVELYEPVYLM